MGRITNRFADIKHSVQNLRARPPAAATGSKRPDGLGEPLDPRAFSRDPKDTRFARTEWQRRVAANGGKATLIPLDAKPLDPNRDTVVVCLGMGCNFQDGHVLAKLKEKHQVVLVAYDATKPPHALGQEALEALHNAFPGAGGPPRMVVVGHSFGCLVGQSLIRAGNEDGTLNGSSPRSTQAAFIAMDAPWRGIDLPFAGKVQSAAQSMTGRLLGNKTQARAQTLINNLGVGSSILNAVTPMDELCTPNPTLAGRCEFATVIREDPARPDGLFPTGSWLSEELRPAERQALYSFFKKRRVKPLHKLHDRDFGKLVRSTAVRNLIQVLGQEADSAGYMERLHEAARTSKSVEEFAAKYDEVVRSIVTVFQGQHTGFMWTDKSFEPWMFSTVDRLMHSMPLPDRGGSPGDQDGWTDG